MSVSSITDSSSLYDILKSLSADSTATKGSSASGTSHRASDRKDGGGPMAFLTQELEKQGYTGSTLSDLQAKIQDAVDKLESSSSGQVDPQTMRDTINGVLKDAGVNTDQIDADFHANHPGGPGGPGGPPPSGGADATSTSATSSSDTLLSELGIDPTAFQSALQSAIDNMGSDGSIDLSKLFASAGVGSQVNVLA